MLYSILVKLNVVMKWIKGATKNLLGRFIMFLYTPNAFSISLKVFLKGKPTAL